jgi:protein gp37
LHPWGDARLNTLRLLNPGTAGTRAGEFHRKLLYDVRDNPKATRFLLAGTLDLFDPGIPDRVFDEHLDVFLRASRHTFLALTPHADSVPRHWKRLNRVFPDNFWTGVSIDCVDHLQRLKILREMDMRTKWASFVDYRSDASRPLSTSSFRADIMGLALVVFAWDFADPQSPLSSEDACSLAQAAKRSDTRFFFTHPKSKQAFLTGNPPISELPGATNPQVSNPGLTALFEEAKSHQRFPDGWSAYADWARKPHFKTFEGEEVELFDLRSDIGESPAAIAEAS